MVNLDGFLLSHSMQSLDTLKPGDFVPPLHLPHAIDVANPAGYGTLTGPEEHFKFRWEIEQSMRRSRKVIAETEKDFADRFGRSYSVAEEYRFEDADVAVIAMGTLGKEAEVAVDLLRNEGVKAGSLRVRWLRPFPDLDLAGRDIVVIDRDYSFGSGGIIAHSLMARSRIEPYSVIAGLGGQEVTYDDIAGFVRDRRPGSELWFGVSGNV
jgi:pyruvate ferredoxin oxidoreductase alpha subunit